MAKAKNKHNSIFIYLLNDILQCRDDLWGLKKTHEPKRNDCLFSIRLKRDALWDTIRAI